MTPAGANVQDTDEDVRLLEEFVAGPLDGPAGAEDVEKGNEELSNYTKDDVL